MVTESGLTFYSYFLYSLDLASPNIWDKISVFASLILRKEEKKGRGNTDQKCVVLIKLKSERYTLEVISCFALMNLRSSHKKKRILGKASIKLHYCPK